MLGLPFSCLVCPVGITTQEKGASLSGVPKQHVINLFIVCAELSLAVACGLLTVVASLAVEHRL